MLEYKAIPINACIFAALCLSCVVQCMISSVRKANALSRDGHDSLDAMWNYCMAFSLLCVLGIMYVAASSKSRAVLLFPLLPCPLWSDSLISCWYASPRIGSAVLLNLYSLPATILVAYAIVIGYSVAWFTNTAFYFGARWAWIIRFYWLCDLIMGLVIIAPLFLISFFRVSDSSLCCRLSSMRRNKSFMPFVYLSVCDDLCLLCSVLRSCPYALYLQQ